MRYIFEKLLVAEKKIENANFYFKKREREREIKSLIGVNRRMEGRQFVSGAKFSNQIKAKSITKVKCAKKLVDHCGKSIRQFFFCCLKIEKVEEKN